MTVGSRKAYSQLKDYLTRFAAQGVCLLNVDSFHLKTLIVDDELIAEGSFNWLSASRNE